MFFVFFLETIKSCDDVLLPLLSNVDEERKVGLYIDRTITNFSVSGDLFPLPSIDDIIKKLHENEYQVQIILPPGKDVFYYHRIQRCEYFLSHNSVKLRSKSILLSFIEGVTADAVDEHEADKFRDLIGSEFAHSHCASINSADQSNLLLTRKKRDLTTAISYSDQDASELSLLLQYHNDRFLSMLSEADDKEIESLLEIYRVFSSHENIDKAIQFTVFVYMCFNQFAVKGFVGEVLAHKVDDGSANAQDQMIKYLEGNSFVSFAVCLMPILYQADVFQQEKYHLSKRQTGLPFSLDIDVNKGLFLNTKDQLVAGSCKVPYLSAFWQGFDEWHPLVMRDVYVRFKPSPGLLQSNSSDPSFFKTNLQLEFAFLKDMDGDGTYIGPPIFDNDHNVKKRSELRLFSLFGVPLDEDFSYPSIQSLLRDVSISLLTMHTQFNKIHRDIKLANIIFRGKRYVPIDFGNAESCGSREIAASAHVLSANEWIYRLTCEEIRHHDFYLQQFLNFILFPTDNDRKIWIGLSQLCERFPELRPQSMAATPNNIKQIMDDDMMDSFNQFSRQRCENPELVISEAEYLILLSFIYCARNLSDQAFVQNRPKLRVEVMQNLISIRSRIIQYFKQVLLKSSQTQQIITQWDGATSADDCFALGVLLRGLVNKTAIKLTNVEHRFLDQIVSDLTNPVVDNRLNLNKLLQRLGDENNRSCQKLSAQNGAVAR